MQIQKYSGNWNDIYVLFKTGFYFSKLTDFMRQFEKSIETTIKYFIDFKIPCQKFKKEP